MTTSLVLLKQIENILSKHEKMAEQTGTHFNIFDVLGLRTKELIHSKFIGNLLNQKAKHGQKDIFLKLFIDVLKDKVKNDNEKKKILNEFLIHKTTLYVEKSIGQINEDKSKGGRVDILLNDGKNFIVIENKIYALDQEKQLVRYRNHYENGVLLYLTLKGEKPSYKSSRSELIDGEDFICISYEIEIKNWIEKCIKAMATKPVVRETLHQYLYLIKTLTNQSFSKEIKMEITKLIIENLNESKLIVENFEYAKNHIVLNFWKNCNEKIKEQLTEWVVELHLNYHNLHNYILIHKYGDKNAFFYCRYNIKDGGIAYGITLNKEIKNIKTNQINVQLDTKSIAGELSVIWELEDNLNLNVIDYLIEIRNSEGVFEQMISEKMKNYILTNNHNYNKTLELVKNYST
ncbi:PD-(D/E)XK nuclease family protein [Flavobacterium filum]|uniref:PDDEXK-like family protein n=1 Tax=Flavobacterium filum TaxID=370974 RepID=UPI0003FFF107|nr:PD-(D/E)XK nuclease family protein [Flavobacterium filum]